MEKRQGVRVLVVGEAEVADVLALPLRHEGHEVALAHDGPSALACAREARPDVVLLDLEAPALQGAAIIQGIHALSPWRRPLFLGLAGYGGQAPFSPSQEVGIDLYLARPIALGRLLHLLRRFQGVLEDIEDFDPVI
jgi:two-component system CheB/CheR fusion protein